MKIEGSERFKFGNLKASLPSEVTYRTLDQSAVFINHQGNVISKINKDGDTIVSSLLSGKSIDEVILSSVSEQKTRTFIRRLYARSLLKTHDENGEVEIPDWSMEPVTDVHLFITHRCNLECVHCLIVDEKKKELTVNNFVHVIDDLIDLGCTDLDITGGDVTVKRSFLDIVDYATAKGLSVGLATNGTNWDEENMERLISSKPEKVNISIYSAIPEVHDEITQKPGSLVKSIAFARKILNSGIPVNFKCMVMRRNFDSFATVAELAAEMGAGYKFDSHITASTNGETKPLNERLNQDQLAKFVKSPYCIQEDQKTVNSEGIVCNAGKDRMSINAYGDVHPCVVFPIKAGNIKEKPLKEIWKNSSVLNEIRSFKFKDFGKCGFCPLLTYCSPCPGASYLEQGNFRETPNWSCNFTNTLIRVKKGGDLNYERGNG